jgi:hypothetical protein
MMLRANRMIRFLIAMRANPGGIDSTVWETAFIPGYFDSNPYAVRGMSKGNRAEN